MSTSRRHRLILALYPAEFRRRYGDELGAVVVECGDGWRVTADLAVSAIRARLNPCLAGSGPGWRRARLETTAATVFAAWVWSTVAVAVFARAVDDQPVPGLRAWGWSAYAVGSVIFELSAAIIVTIGFGYWLRVVVPAARSRNRKTFVPAVLPLGVVPLWLAGTGGLAVAVHHTQPGRFHHYATQGPHAAGAWALLGAYSLFTLACVGLCTAGVRRALRNAELPLRDLTLSAVVALGASVALAAISACAAICLIRVLMIGGMSVRDELSAIGPVGFLLVATATAATSSVRGVRAERTAPTP